MYINEGSIKGFFFIIILHYLKQKFNTSAIKVVRCK